ncbi:Uncharacterised protein [Mycobacteroides abscessus subsp. abscessus]|nr:Uncharacterised protein [Mycobacteroides abscessus]SHU24107.1 Uncharacterised protein [Mycobacteroides abscessus subsp. abscessus]SKS72287.1 Uncharacterised protein [Mycobacteroides abscessus subsp. abscessus]SKU06178.1 Uncharacterised protein [Mycobacteroides abscessus subsp. abscessus]
MMRVVGAIVKLATQARTSSPGPEPGSDSSTGLR